MEKASIFPRIVYYVPKPGLEYRCGHLQNLTFQHYPILSTGEGFSSRERWWVLFWTCRWISSRWLWYGFEGPVSDLIWSQILREGARETTRSPLNCSKCDLLCSWARFLSFVTPQEKAGMIFFGRVRPSCHSPPLSLNPAPHHASVTGVG